MNRKCIAGCGRDRKSERAAYCSGRCAQKAWRKAHKGVVRAHNRAYRLSLEDNSSKMTTTRLLSSYDIRVRAIDQCIAGKIGGYKWR